MNKQLAAVAAMVILTVGVSAQAMVPKELAAFQGTWDVVSVGGESLAASGATGEITVTGDKYEVKINGAVNERGTIKVDATKTPMTIDFHIVEGPESTGGMLQLGIFEITGDTARFHLAAPGLTPRPANFEPLPNHDIIIIKKRAAVSE
jgi:uncharacterized protein (TIGR03067 family)